MSDLQPDKNTSVFPHGHIDRSTWKRVRLGDFESHRNNTCARSLMTSDIGSVHNIHYGDILVKYDEVVSLLHHNVDCLTVEGETNSPKDYICDGDVIIADTAEDETVGKTVEIQDVGNSKVVAGLHTFLYRPPSNMFVRGWLGYWMNSSAYHSQLFQYMTGTKVLSLTRTSIAATVIQYPSRELQQQIVTALDSIQTQINATQKLIAKYEAIKKATVNLLLTPKSGWERVKLGDVAVTSSGGTPNRSNEGYYQGTIPWFTTSELHDEVLYDSKEHISEEALQKTTAKVFPAGTLLLAMYGATIGKLGVLAKPAATNQACCAIKCGSNVETAFLFQVLINRRQELVALGCGAGQPNISQQIVQNLSLVLPPLSEQRKIAEKIIAIDNALADYKAQLEKARKLKAGMMSYFFG